jgi:GNAT superfamily N-acetyltransferase
VDFLIRAAVASEAPAIAAVAAAAWRDTYAGLLRVDTIETFIERAYSRERLESRIDRDVFLVAERPVSGVVGRAGSDAEAADALQVVAFCDARDGDSHVELYAIYALPEARGQGAGTALLRALQARHPGRPIAAEVLAGNRKGETFYERRGFVPRERIDTELFGETVVERRWWLTPG